MWNFAYVSRYLSICCKSLLFSDSKDATDGTFTAASEQMAWEQHTGHKGNVKSSY